MHADEIGPERCFNRERDFAWMTIPNSVSHQASTEAKLPRRDWVLLPLISLFTIGLLVVFTESVSKRMFSESRSEVGCWVEDDPLTGVRGIPNCTCWEKFPESQLTVYRFNSCGHRAAMECGPKALGTYRIVMVGSSYTMGAGVSEPETFAALLPADLSRRTGRKVELYNEGMMWGSPYSIDLRFGQVLAAKPDMILWILTPWDIKNSSRAMPGPAMPVKRGFMRATRQRVQEALARESISDAVSDISEGLSISLAGTRSGLLLQHFFYESQTQYVKLYLLGGDDPGFLRAQPSAEMKSLIQKTDFYAADIEARAIAAGVPLVAVLVPNRAQAAMISMGEWPAGYDPYELSDEIRRIVVSRGGTYIDILPAYREIANSEQGYFPVNGHPNAGGHATIAKLIARELTGGAVPALRVISGPQDILKKGE
jgi:hypothetical protein